MQDLTDKVAVVTGGASGIGLAIAKALGREGCHVVISDLDQERCVARAREIETSDVKAIGVACDVTCQNDIDRLCETSWQNFGHVDLLFNNAGVGGGNRPAHKTDEQDLRWVFEVNFFANWHVCMRFLRRFLEQKTPAHIVNTGSENSFGWPFAGMAGYNASKAAVLAYSGLLRMELPDFIGISVLCPGLTKTEISQSGALRPDKYGGPRTTIPRETADLIGGYPADQVGTHTVEMVKQGAFYIVPHYAARHLAEERNEELMRAFDAQAPYHDDWKAFDTRTIVTNLMKNR